MKQLQTIAWIIFLLGLIFKLLHYPGAAILLILGSTLLFIYSLVYLFKNLKTNLPYSFLNLSFSFWTIYLMFRFQYWNFAQEIFVVAFLVTITCLSLHLINQTKFKLPQIILTLYFLFSIKIAYTNSDRIFYFFNLNTILNYDSRNLDFHSWDKYSWFLYIVNKQDEAIIANQNAQKAVDEYLKITQFNDELEYSTLIKQHGKLIRDKNWTTFP